MKRTKNRHPVTRLALLVVLCIHTWWISATQPSASESPTITTRFNYPTAHYTNDEDPPAPECQTLVLDTLAQVIRHQKQGMQCHIRVAMYTFDDPALIRTFATAIDAGVDVDILLDSGQAAKRKHPQNATDVQALHTVMTHINVVGHAYAQNSGTHAISPEILHEKYATFQCGHQPHPRVILGSYNWTTAATRYNHENSVAIDDNATWLTFVQHHADLRYIHRLPALKGPVDTRPTVNHGSVK